MIFPKRPTGTVQKLLLCDLCVFANFAINIPETVSTCAASQALAARLPPVTHVVDQIYRGGLAFHHQAQRRGPGLGLSITYDLM
jgi:hypothetical protein